jgi:hypothetical protein
MIAGQKAVSNLGKKGWLVGASELKAELMRGMQLILE